MKRTSRKTILKKCEESESDDGVIDQLKSNKRPKRKVDPVKYTRHHLPMLAYDYNKKKDKVIFPCFVQPKLDGVRALFYNNKFYSRNGNEFLDLNHIKQELGNPNLILDGELYTGEIPFEELVGLVKKQTKSPEDHKKCVKLKYIIYDYVNENETFSSRHYYLNKFFDEKIFIETQCLMTEECKSEEELKKFHDKYKSMGYEGLIIRNKQGLYKEKDRSDDLLKYKEFLDAEYEIIDYKCGSGADYNCVIWVCVNKDGNTFCVRPKGTIEYRTKLYHKGKSYIGKLLTVKYQNLSKDGIPRFPVGISIRDYE